MMQTSLLILVRLVTPLHYMWDCVYGLSLFSPNVLQINPRPPGRRKQQEN